MTDIRLYGIGCDSILSGKLTFELLHKEKKESTLKTEYTFIRYEPVKRSYISSQREDSRKARAATGL